jgi:hypothetical protein
MTVIEVKRCADEVCVADIDDKINTIDVEVIFSNANFNPKDLQNSVTYFMDVSLSTQLIPNLKKRMAVSLLRQSVYSIVNLFGLYPTTEHFY